MAEERKIARRYATALFSESKRLKIEEEIKECLHFLISILDRSIIDYLTSPRVKASDKERIILCFLPENAPLLFKNFLYYLLIKKRISCIHLIKEYYDTLYDIDQNILRVDLKTAIPLDDTLRKDILKRLEKLTGKKIILQEEVDKDILGGILIKIGDKIIDGTITNYLKILRENLLSVKI